MAQKKQLALRKQEIVQQLSVSRNTISDHKKIISTKLSPKVNIRSLCSKISLKDPKVAVAGSFLLAVTTSLLLKRKKSKPEVKKRSKKLLLLGLGFKLIKPSIKKVVFNQVKSLAVQRLANRSQQFAQKRNPVFRRATVIEERGHASNEVSHSTSGIS